MDHDVIPTFPELYSHEMEDQSIDQHFEQFKKSEVKFMIYERETGETEILFSKLDVRLYANLVAKLCCPLHIKVHEYLKLVLESVRLIKLNTKKGYESAVRIEKYMMEQDKT